jgi:predicted polyphosphate/ATP-dependent NAD kinase
MLTHIFKGGVMMATVGIIANPASGKDIRRLVAYGTTFDNQQKVSIVRRALLGIDEVGVEQLVYMPDYYNIVPRALEGLWNRHHLLMDITALDMEMKGVQEDSAHAARLMQEMGVDCIVTLGGDGTNRMVAKGCGDIPLVPISTGTNNVFPQMVEGTIAGLAAGVVARGLVKDAKALVKTKKIHVLREDTTIDIALIDAVVLKDAFIGSRAIWDEECLSQIFVTRGEAHSIGISSIAGNIEPLGMSEEKGMLINIGPGNIVVHVPIAPGLIRPVAVKNYRMIMPGEKIAITETPCTIALDGEREVEVRDGKQYFMQLQMDGPLVVDVSQALREAVRNGYAIR